MSRLKPLHNFIIVKQIEAEHVSLGGIIIPDIFDKPTGLGHAIAVGPGIRDDNGDIKPMSTTEGDKLLYPSLVGHKIIVDKVEYLVIKESDVFAIVK